MISSLLQDKPLPVYGDGMNVRVCLYVEDHCSAIDMVLNKVKLGANIILASITWV